MALANEPDHHPAATASQVGIRALKQHASQVIARVVAGESIEVTDRGRPVAEIIPLQRDRVRQLVEGGQLTEPALGFDDYSTYLRQRETELRERGIPLGPTNGRTSQHILDELRQERF